MKIVRAGTKRINLEYLICAEEWDGTADTAGLAAGDVLVTLESGRRFALRAEAGREFLDLVDAEIEATCPPPSAVARAYDPATGEPVFAPGSRQAE